MLGGCLYATFNILGWPDNEATVAAISGALLLRLAAIYWQVSLPAFDIIDKESTDAEKK